MRFHNRTEAGRVLAPMVQNYANRSDIIVLALPKGGVPVAYEVATALNVPMDLFLVRKLGVPGNEELAMGAIASGGIVVLNDDVIDSLHISDEAIKKIANAEQQELERLELIYRGEREYPTIPFHCVILVDDGMATGASMRAAGRAIQSRNPSKTVIAVPVAPPETCRDLKREVNDVVSALTPEPFEAISSFYEDFPQMTDDDVREIYERAAQRLVPARR